MAREDKYAAGLAGGTGLALGGAYAATAGRNMRRDGRAQASANRGSRGMDVRGGRLIRAGSDQVREGSRSLGQFKRVTNKNGTTTYLKPGGGFAPTKQFTEQISRGNQTARQGEAFVSSAKSRRAKAVAGLKQMKRGRFVARGGAIAAGLGAATAVGSVAAGERYRSRRVRQMDSALNPALARREPAGRNQQVAALRPKRAPEGARKFREDPTTGKWTEEQSARVKQWEDSWRRQLGES